MDDISVIRLSAFLTIFVSMGLLELWLPARHLPKTVDAPQQTTRWTGNIGILLISALTARLVLPIGLAGIALYCQQQQIGLFNALPIPAWASMIISLLLLDLLIYWQHRLFHRVPLLWRLHQVHHADVHVDTTTGLRFHPFEIVISIGVKALAILMLGVPVDAVVIFEILLNGFAIFQHANIKLAPILERLVRTVLFTQMLHRIHHSQLLQESNSNFGFSIVWWDRLFGTYLAKATKADDAINIGLIEYPRAPQNAWLTGLLWMPFTNIKK